MTLRQDDPSLMLLRDGRQLDLARPDWRVMDLGDIAHSLARQVRYCANCPRPVSIAEHSIAVAALAPERLALAALLHDAHEAFLGDVTRPVEAALARRMGEHGDAFVAALWAMRQVLDVEIAMLALTLAPGFAGVNSGTLLHARAAAAVCSEMWSAPLVMADAGAGLMERQAFFPAPGRAGPAPAVITRIDALYVFGDASVTEIASAWLDAVEHHVAQRFAQRREPLAGAAS